VSAEEMKSLCASEPTCVGYTREPGSGKFKPKSWIQKSYSAPGYTCTLLVDDASGVEYESIGTNATCLSEDAPNGGDLTDYLPCDLSCAIKQCNADPRCVGLTGTGNGAYKLKSVIDGTSPGSYGECIQKIGSSNGATSDGATSDGATSDGATSDGATSDGATSDGATSDGATSDSATFDGATSDGATSDGATSDGATSDGATSDGATSDGADGSEQPETEPDDSKMPTGTKIGIGLAVFLVIVIGVLLCFRRRRLSEVTSDLAVELESDE
jgi:hypothetical protein